MNKGGLRIIIIMASLWAVICGGFTYDVVQREKKILYQAVVVEKDPAGQGEIRTLPLRLPAEDKKKADLAAYRQGLTELYWVFTPFLWVSLTLSGYIVAAGFLLPVHRVYRWVKQKQKKGKPFEK